MQKDYAMNNKKIQLSRSQLETFSRCRKKYWFREIRGLESGPPSKPMSQGTLGHIGLAGGYEAFRKLQEAPNLDMLNDVNLLYTFKQEAHKAMEAALAKGISTYRGEEQPLGLTKDDPESQTIFDAVDYYADANAVADFKRYEILAVEKPFEYNILVTVPDGTTAELELSGVFDVLARDREYKKNQAVVIDHKFVGNVTQSKEFLRIDLQMLLYEVICWEVTRRELGFDDAHILYNMVRREVPPGYGSRPEKTASGAKSTASRNMHDYLSREDLFHSDSQRRSLQQYFSELSTEVVRTATAGGPWPLTQVKTGGEACSQCSFFSACGVALVGGAPQIGNLL